MGDVDKFPVITLWNINNLSTTNNKIRRVAFGHNVV